jgi:hypothetical protein
MTVIGGVQPHARPTKQTELGTERLCAGCLEWWPEDEDFWYYQRGRILGRCRACWSERRIEGRKRTFLPLDPA